MIQMDEREAREALRHAQYGMEDAAREAQRTKEYYARMYMTAARFFEAQELDDMGFPEPGEIGA